MHMLTLAGGEKERENPRPEEGAGWVAFDMLLEPLTANQVECGYYWWWWSSWASAV
jgi:hypothetical protein